MKRRYEYGDGAGYFFYRIAGVVLAVALVVRLVWSLLR